MWGWLATKEGESVDLKGQDLVLYETAIQEALEQEKLYYRKKSAPFNLMDYYDADDSVKEKVQNLDIQVKKEQDGLYVCASLALIEPLTQQELEAIQNFLSRQYEGGIFDTSRIRTYSVEEGEVVFDFSVDTKEKFSQKEVQCETQKKYEITPMIILRMIMQELSMMTASIQMKQRILPVMILIQMIPARIQALTVLLTAAIHLPATAVLLLTPVRELTLETSS